MFPLYVHVKDRETGRNLNSMTSKLSQPYLSSSMEIIFQGYQSINFHKNKNKATKEMLSGEMHCF